jgi:AAA family ATP:ADP antiporter
VLDLRFNGLLEEAAPFKDERTAYLGKFYFHLNVVAFYCQFVAAPVLLRLCSLRLIHAAIPLVHLASCSLLLARPSLVTSDLAFLLFKTLDYSIFRAGKEILYIPLSFDARYRAKQVIDAFGYRASKGVTSGLLALASIFRSLPGVIYPLIAMISSAGWLFFVTKLTKAPGQDQRGI